MAEQEHSLKQIKSFAEGIDHSLSQMIQLLQDPRYLPDWFACSSSFYFILALFALLCSAGMHVCVNLMFYRINFSLFVSSCIVLIATFYRAF